MNRVIRQILGTIVAAGVFIFFVFVLIVTFVARRRPRRSTTSLIDGSGLRVLVTGRVNSENWCKAHLLPLAQAASVSKLLVVMDGPIVRHEKIVNLSNGSVAPGGRLLARSWTLFKIAWREKPDILIGYSLFPAALLCLFATRIFGGVAIYQLTGGSAEINAAGISSDHPRFELPSAFVRALRPLARLLANAFDAVIVRGRRTKAFLGNTETRRVKVIAGAVDPARFTALRFEERPYDIAFVGRLVAVKQPDHLLQIALRVQKQLGNFRGVIVGAGPLRSRLEQEANRLGLGSCLQFAGHLDRVEDILNRTRFFLLTSKSEGLSIALAEAMMAGAVPVVADVGDLNELVVDGRTGWLVEPGGFETYAARICLTSRDVGLWTTLSRAANDAAVRNNALTNVTLKWEECFRGIFLNGAHNVHPSNADPVALLDPRSH